MTKQLYDIIINVCETTWSTAEVVVEAESMEEAIAQFEQDPWDHEWDNWATYDSELRDWDVNVVATERANLCHLDEDE
jgi:hypothetical protein|tara:strand:- start:1285 stop:1518 length:234 start_codon:yes stop_codon:yes gene_type:complete